ncbi:MAG: class I SAM-dependent rRNA methyltransferase [Paludibacteraceae bacterium]|nr:class I SAM-dependent rRNA methyltransferase [Paludibacteraceae bacterium]
MTIYLKPHKEESVLRFHPWVFSGAVARIDGNPSEGEVVSVVASDGTALGAGHYQIGSIAVRLLTFSPNEKIDAAFFRRRIESAYNMRKALGLIRKDNDTYRLVHGEGDMLPGLIIDVYGDTAVMQAHSVGMHLIRRELAEIVKDVVVEVSNVYYKSEGTLPYKAPLEERDDGYLIGNEGQSVGCENGLKFNIDWLRGQKTGFFVDQRDNRSLLERYSRDRNVLNMFCYTGGFSVYALRGGALSVHSVDSSAKAIELTERNVNLNFGECERHKAFAEDAFRFLDNMQQAYDLIILDPPAFAKHRGAIRNALQGYRRLNQKALEKIAPHSILFTFSCSQVVDKDMFRLAVFSAAAAAKRQVRILHQLTQPADHPINIYHPEGEYLKGLVLYVE